MNILILAGDYKARQVKANEAAAGLYLELHLNSASPSATGVETWVATNASSTSKRVAAEIGRALSKRTGLILRHGGVAQVGGRAEGSVVYTAMPAVLVEIGFCSNADDLAVVKDLVDEVADALLDAVEVSLSGIELLALSVGHVGKTSNKADRGAALADRSGYEADVTLLIASRLMQMAADPTRRRN